MAVVLIGIAEGVGAQAPVDNSRWACTSILVGRKASADGSVMTSHTCDSWYRTWMRMAPATGGDKADDKAVQPTSEPIYGGRMHTESAADSANLKERGRIAAVSKTYRYLDTAYPCLNEKQLAIGETTFGGRDTLQNKQGLFMIEELCRVALERCTTAREAIQLIDRLTQTYGYGDSGECLTIADPKEAWFFEIMGAGPDTLGAVWAAVRIPDDEVAVSANISRIGRIDATDSDHYMISSNAYDVARRLGLWNGTDEFCWWRVFSGGNYFDEEKNYSVREYYILSELAPSLCLSDTVAELPLSVKPEQKLTPRRVSELLGSYFEGTKLCLADRLKVPNKRKKSEEEADTIVSPVANPWMDSAETLVYHELGDTAMTYQRTVSVPWCAYSTVIQCREWLPDAVGAVAWVALDNPGESPRFPIFAGQTELPTLLSICGQHRDREDAALWHYRKANRLATVRWGRDREMIEKGQDHFLKKAEREMSYVENQYKELEKSSSDEATAFLNDYSADFFGATIQHWDALERTLWRKTWAGF